MGRGGEAALSWGQRAAAGVVEGAPDGFIGGFAGGFTDTALADGTYRDGFAAGLGRSLQGGMQGAAVGAAFGGVVGARMSTAGGVLRRGAEDALPPGNPFEQIDDYTSLADNFSPGYVGRRPLTSRAVDLGDEGFPVFAEDRLARIRTSLQKEGVTFEVGGQAAAAKLRAAGADGMYEPRLGKPGNIVLSGTPSRRTVVEELIHLGQARKLGWPFIDNVLEASLELTAHERLLRVARRLRWTAEEIQDIAFKRN